MSYTEENLTSSIPVHRPITSLTFLSCSAPSDDLLILLGNSHKELKMATDNPSPSDTLLSYGSMTTGNRLSTPSAATYDPSTNNHGVDYVIEYRFATIGLYSSISSVQHELTTSQIKQKRKLNSSNSSKTLMRLVLNAKSAMVTTVLSLSSFDSLLRSVST